MLMLQEPPSSSLMDCMNLAEKLEKLMDMRGLNQATLARMAGLPPTRISDWVRPSTKRKPTLEQAMRLARALNTTVDFLADNSLDEPPMILNDDEKWAVETARMLGPAKTKRRLLGLTDPAPASTDSQQEPQTQEGWRYLGRTEYPDPIETMRRQKEALEANAKSKDASPKRTPDPAGRK